MPGERPRRETLLLLALATVQLTHVVDFMIMIPLGAQFMRVFAVGPQQFGLLVSAYALAASASGFLAAFRIDRYDRKPALVFLYAGFVASTLACGMAPGYWSLLVARTVAGAFGGVLAALIVAIVSDLVPYARRGRAMALIGASFSIASVVGVPVGLFIADRFGWRWAFIALAVVSLPVLLASARLLPPLRSHLTGERPRSSRAQLAAIFGHANHLRAFAFIVALTFGGFTVLPFVAPYLATTVGVAESDLALVYLVGGSATLVSSQLIGRLADRYGKKRVFTAVAALSIGPILLMTQLPAVPLGSALVASTIFFVLVTGRFGPAIALVSGSVEPRLRGSFMSFNASVQQAGAGLASLAAGALIATADDGALVGFDRVGYVAAAATLLTIALAWRIRVAHGAGEPA